MTQFLNLLHVKSVASANAEGLELRERSPKAAAREGFNECLEHKLGFLISDSMQFYRSASIT